MKPWLSLVVTFHCLTSSYGQNGFIDGQPRLAYWQIGQQKQTVIVLHGGPAVQHEYLRPEFDALKKSATVIYYDQRGCGKSDTASSYLWQEHVADLRRVVQTVSKKSKVFLVGSSWGSLLALLYTYMHPEDVKGLILSGTVKWQGEEQVYTKGRYYPGKPEYLTMAEKRVVTKRTVEGQLKQDTIRVSKAYQIYYGSPQVETLESLKSAPVIARLQQIKQPILLITGRLATTTINNVTWRYDGVEQYEKVFPNVHVHTLNMAGHDPWLSDPTLFFSLSNDFIQQVSR